MKTFILLIASMLEAAFLLPSIVIAFFIFFLYKDQEKADLIVQGLVKNRRNWVVSLVLWAAIAKTVQLFFL